MACCGMFGDETYMIFLSMVAALLCRRPSDFRATLKARKNLRKIYKKLDAAHAAAADARRRGLDP